MEIIEKRLAELTPYKNNPRKNDQAVDAVAASIKAFGFKVPIVIDRDGVIVCGHTRAKAAKKLKLESVPCVVADDLTEEEIKAFRIADNSSGAISEWDLALLDLELSDIDFDMSEFGLDIKQNEPLPFPDELDDERTKENIIVTMNCKSIKDFESIKEELSRIIEGKNITMAVKMA